MKRVFVNRMWVYFFSIMVMLIYIVLPQQARANDVHTVYTSHLPPLTINSIEKGISHQIIEDVARTSGLFLNIDYKPWKRSQVLVQDDPKGLIMSMAQTESRKDKYQWVAKLIEVESIFISRDQQINSFTQAGALDSIAVLMGTPRMELLAQSDMGNYFGVTKPALAARMLRQGRVDAWFTLSHRAKYVFDTIGYIPRSLKFGQPISKDWFWLAANLEFDQEYADHLREMIDRYRQSPTYEKLVGQFTFQKTVLVKK